MIFATLDVSAVVKLCSMRTLKQCNRLISICFFFKSLLLLAWYFFGLDPLCYVAQNAESPLKIF